MICPICGTGDGACHGQAPYFLPVDLLAEGGPNVMVSNEKSGDAKAVYPEMEVSEGQVHGYVGDVTVVPATENEPGQSNTEPEQVDAPVPSGRRGRNVGEG